MPIETPACGCARGWICAEHENQPFAHDGCAGAGTRCRSAVCPYWQAVSGARGRLALDPAIQFDQNVEWAEHGTRH